MNEILHLSKDDVAQIIATWWADYAADPSAFNSAPDLAGASSADVFFAYAEKLGLGK